MILVLTLMILTLREEFCNIVLRGAENRPVMTVIASFAVIVGVEQKMGIMWRIQDRSVRSQAG